MNNKVNLLDLPEIISHVGRFLDQNDHLICIRVSKIFYSTLIRSIWRTILVSSVQGYPSGEALQNNKKYIEGIRLYGDIPKEIHLTRYSVSDELWQTLLGCTNLERLEIAYTRTNANIDLFFQLPFNFQNSEASEHIFPNMHTLSIRSVKIINPPYPYTSSYCLGMLVRECPGLCALTFDDGTESYKIEQPKHNDFRRAAFLQHPWALTNLSELCMPSMIIKDEELAALLRQMTELRKLQVPSCELGQLSLQELLTEKQGILSNGHTMRKTRHRRLCETVEVLTFNVQSADGIVQAILSNCPRLKRMRGSKVTVTEIVNGSRWVSTNLTDLNIYLEADVDQETAEGMAKSRIASKQLGKLTRLRYLDLTRQSPRIRGKNGQLDIKLRAGLDELVNLKNLTWLWFRYDGSQRLDFEDATWIVNNWPNIEFLSHFLIDDDLSVSTSVDSLFGSRNIIRS
ncbi:hypothetical protein BCR41DRAFT_356692 [Lobosporangium transversale]|uniref:F-box domain-containing protein n=1 Tax=Lobosporangium transversale TaxID=64571 RepID=A0A1Y2GI63_9FUNG|nr:hypothetical protein BCR41DRAFT_356692 [Lobosporangium transversale]ORZ11640.1 hypothetical protein BCR41DRAFT_356692 [Lobosporangium transversale]|eukprot:XP_021879737.1 hypothetical protein BCR41DRAFT_356692 [Lobosporangium transversale]